VRRLELKRLEGALSWSVSHANRWIAGIRHGQVARQLGVSRGVVERARASPAPAAADLDRHTKPEGASAFPL
jgi:hypothetical protein